MRKTITWLWSLPWSWIVSAVSLAAAFIIWRSKKNNVSTFEDAVEVRKLQESAARDTARANELVLDANATAEDIELVHREIEASRRAILAIAADLPPGKIYEMSHAEIVKALTDAGF